MSTDSKVQPKVLLISTWFPHDKAPTSGIFVERDARALNEVVDLHVVHLVNPSIVGKIRTRDVNGLTVTQIPVDLKNPLSLYRAARYIQPLLNATDIVHTHAMSTLIPLRLTSIHVPWIHTEHWSGYVDWNFGWRNCVRHAMARLARRPNIVVSVSSVLATTIEKLSRRPVAVIPNIVEYGGLESRSTSLEDASLKIVAVGNLIERKRPLLAARTCHELNKRGYSTALTWIGEGILRDDLESYCHEHSVTLRLPGVLTGSEVAREYARADVSIFPTKAETFGLVGAEALAAGRPLVAGSNGGQRDYIESPTGILVDGEDPKEWASAIEKVLADTQYLTAEEIAAPIRQRFSAECLRMKYLALYRKLLGHQHLL